MGWAVYLSVANTLAAEQVSTQCRKSVKRDSRVRNKRKRRSMHTECVRERNGWCQVDLRTGQEWEPIGGGRFEHERGQSERGESSKGDQSLTELFHTVFVLTELLNMNQISSL